jgi:hypothetical protein
VTLRRPQRRGEGVAAHAHHDPPRGGRPGPAETACGSEGRRRPGDHPGERAADLIKADRGIPANPEIRAHLETGLDENARVEYDFVDRMSGLVDGDFVIGPTGSTESVDILTRVNQAVLFGQSSPDQGAEQFVTEPAVSANSRSKSGRALPNRTSGERDARQPQVRDQTEPSLLNASGEAEQSA